MKKYLSLVLAAVILIGSLSLAACSTVGQTSAAANTGDIQPGNRVGAADTYYGDADFDGSVTMKDVLLVRKSIAGVGDAVDVAAGDVNGDSSVDMKDVLLIRKYVANMIDKFPIEEGTVVTTAAPTTTETMETVTLKLQLTKKGKYADDDVTDTYSWDFVKGQSATVSVTLTGVYKAFDKTADELFDLVSMDGSCVLNGNPTVGATVDNKNDVTYTYTVVVDNTKTVTGTVAFYEEDATVTVEVKGGAVPTQTTTVTTQATATTGTTMEGETTVRTSAIRKTTQSTHHDKISFAGQPKIDFISGSETLGVWWWKIADGTNLEIREKYLDFLEYNQVTEVYYYCYDSITTPNRRSEVHEFVQSAMTRNMRVAFLYDDPNSVKADNTYVTDKLVPNYLAYKAEYPADAVYGLHLDVETKSALSLLQGYIDNFLITEIAPAREQGIYIELDLSMNYVNKMPTYQGTAQNYYDIVARFCDTMCMMSYRTSSSKIVDGTSVARAAAKKYGKKIVFGIELGDSGEGSGVDFSRSNKTNAYKVLKEVDTALAKESLPAGYGYAVHSMRAWFELKDA